MLKKTFLFLVLCSLLALGSSTPLPAGRAADGESQAGIDSAASLDGAMHLDEGETGLDSLLFEASESSSILSCSFGTCSNDFDCRVFQLLCPPGVTPVCVLPGGASCSGTCSCGPVDQ